MRLTNIDYSNPAINQSVIIETRSKRIVIIKILCLIWSSILIARLVTLQITGGEVWQEWALKQHFGNEELASERGAILDRKGRLLAVSVPSESIYVRTKSFAKGKVSSKTASIALAEVLKKDPAEIEKKLQEDKPFVWLSRQITRQDADKVKLLAIPGVNSILEARRYYPFGASGSSLIGLVDIDGKGLSGLEQLYEKTLSPLESKRTVSKDAHGNTIEEERDFSVPNGANLKTTIDANFQEILSQELERGRVDTNAKATMGVLIDADTGDILALGQSPSSNFNDKTPVEKDTFKNLLIEAVFEPGSIFKPLVTAAALQEGVVKATDKIDCENGHLQVGKHTVKDVHPSGVITVHDVVVRSSNVGMTKIGFKLGKEKLYDYITRYGFGRKSGLGISGESSGILRNQKNWAQIDIATHSFGQGVAVTPLQMVRGLSALVNGGVVQELGLLQDRTDRKPSQRIISEEVAQLTKDMLFGVVEEEHGTGGKAEIQGIRIGGKTGTAQKAKTGGRGYESGKYVASFLGFADATDVQVNEKYVLLVSVDEPKGAIYGGAVAAPIFKRVMARMVQGIMIDREVSK